MSEATYSLLKVKYGICHFARVKLSIEKVSSTNVVSHSLPDNLLRQGGRRHYEVDPHWIEAALVGAEEALRFITERNARFHKVCLLDIFGVDIDTREDAVKCSASLAILNHVFQQNLEAGLTFMDDQALNGGYWSIDYEKLKFLTSA